MIQPLFVSVTPPAASRRRPRRPLRPLAPLHPCKPPCRWRASRPADALPAMARLQRARGGWWAVQKLDGDCRTVTQELDRLRDARPLVPIPIRVRVAHGGAAHGERMRAHHQGQASVVFRGKAPAELQSDYVVVTAAGPLEAPDHMCQMYGLKIQGENVIGQRAISRAAKEDGRLINAIARVITAASHGQRGGPDFRLRLGGRGKEGREGQHKTGRSQAGRERSGPPARRGRRFETTSRRVPAGPRRRHRPVRAGRARTARRATNPGQRTCKPRTEAGRGIARGGRGPARDGRGGFRRPARSASAQPEDDPPPSTQRSAAMADGMDAPSRRHRIVPRLWCV